MDYHTNDSHDQNHLFEEETTIASPPNEGEIQTTIQSELDATLRLPETIDPKATLIVEPYASVWPNSDSDLPLPLPTHVDTLDIFQDDNTLLPNWRTLEDDTVAGYPLSEVENPGTGSNSALLQDFMHTPLLNGFMEHSNQSFRDPELFILPDNVAGTAENQQQVQSDAFLPGLQECIDVHDFFDAQPQSPLRVGNVDDGIYPHPQAMQGYHTLDVTMQQTLAADLLPPFDAASATGWTPNETAPYSLNHLLGAELLLSDDTNFSIGNFGLLSDVSAPGLPPPFSEPVSDVGLSQQFRPETVPTTTEGLFWSQTLDTLTETSMDVTSTQHNATNDDIEVQGPSRPVRLPPRRKGGRKGPLSVQEKERRKEARNQGVCIRCRRMRERCSGGFPCVNCYTKSKAPRWKYPCIRAGFLDIVESGTYIGSICRTEKKVIREIDRKTIEVQVASILRIAERQDTTIFKSNTLGFRNLEGVINWYAALNILEDVLRRCNQGGEDKTVSHHMFDAVRCIAKEKRSLPPITVSAPPPSGSWYQWADAHLQFCIFGCNGTSQVESISGLDESISPIDDCGWEILIWLSRRHFELRLFQDLQGLANKMTSTSSKESSTREKSDTANIFFTCLCLGQRPDSEGRHETPASTERQNQIRSALHSYLRIAIDNLPSFSNFWPGLLGEDMRSHLEELEADQRNFGTFDAQNSASRSMLFDYRNRCQHAGTESRDLQSNVDPDDLEHLAIISLEIATGRTRVVLVVPTLSRLSNVGNYQELLNAVNNMHRDQRNCREKLEKDPRNIELIKKRERTIFACTQWTPQSWAEALDIFYNIRCLFQQFSDVSEKPANDRNHEDGDCDLQTEHEGTT